MKIPLGHITVVIHKGLMHVLSDLSDSQYRLAGGDMSIPYWCECEDCRELEPIFQTSLEAIVVYVLEHGPVPPFSFIVVRHPRCALIKNREVLEVRDIATNGFHICLA